MIAALPVLIPVALAYFFPWTCAVLFLAMILSIIRGSRLKNLERLAYQADVAAFGWSDDIDPLEFEKRCAEAMRLAGWTARTTKGSGDQGVDVVAERQGVRVVLQCKRYSNAVGNKAVQEAFAAKTFASARHAAVVSNNTYTRGARELAARTGVLLLHFSDLAHPNRLFGLPDAPTLNLSNAARDLEEERRMQAKSKGVFTACVAAALGLAGYVDWTKLQSKPPNATAASASESGTAAAPKTTSLSAPAPSPPVEQAVVTPVIHPAIAGPRFDGAAGAPACRAPQCAKKHHPSQVRKPL